MYGLFIQDEFVKGISYGMKTYETHGPSIIAVAPGQIGGVEDNGELITRKGWVLLWSPELTQGTAWEKKMEGYGFFSYYSSNSLEMTPTEWNRISLLISQMRNELLDNEDTPALRSVLQGYLHVILEYCNRIYMRQATFGDKDSSDMLKRFHQLLLDYYAENKPLSLGVPSVQYCASELAYSPRYLGDMIHKATGGTAIGYIHSFVVERGGKPPDEWTQCQRDGLFTGLRIHAPLQPDLQESDGAHSYGISGEIGVHVSKEHGKRVSPIRSTST